MEAHRGSRLLSVFCEGVWWGSFSAKTTRSSWGRRGSESLSIIAPEFNGLKVFAAVRMDGQGGFAVEEFKTAPT